VAGPQLCTADMHGRDEDKNLKGPAASQEASQLPSSLTL
jgi:hypothetical protein